LALLALILCSGLTFAASGAPDVMPQSVKAAFLYQFLSYIEWPASALQPDAALTIGIAGADRVRRELEQLVSGRTVNGRAVRVRPIQSDSSLEGICLLFIGADAAGRLPRLRRAAEGRHVVLVTETARGLDRGSVINFVVKDRRVRFEISMPAARRAGIDLSSRLLAVAQTVRKDTP
jgi:hypothetical protein